MIYQAVAIVDEIALYIAISFYVLDFKFKEIVCFFLGIINWVLFKNRLKRKIFCPIFWLEAYG